MKHLSQGLFGICLGMENEGYYVILLNFTSWKNVELGGRIFCW